MSEIYDAVQITEDAIAFAQSRYGQHHLKRLTKQRDRYFALSTDESQSASYCARMSAKAAVYQAELDYFATAIRVKADKKLWQKLLDKVRNKKGVTTADLDV